MCKPLFELKKELEILEILKPKIKNCINFLNFCNKEEKSLVKNWLENNSEVLEDEKKV